MRIVVRKASVSVTYMAKNKLNTKLVKNIIIVVAILLVAVGGGIAFRWWQAQQTAQTPLPALPKVVDDLQNLRDTADQTVFDSELDKALADPSTDSETRYLLYVQQGHYAMQNQEWQTALEAYGKAQAIKDIMEVNRLLGEAYYAAGDTARAIEQYRKAINLILDTNPRRDAIKEEYESRIKQFESGETIETEETSEEEVQP